MAVARTQFVYVVHAPFPASLLALFSPKHTRYSVSPALVTHHTISLAQPSVSPLLTKHLLRTAPHPHTAPPLLFPPLSTCHTLAQIHNDADMKTRAQTIVKEQNAVLDSMSTIRDAALLSPESIERVNTTIAREVFPFGRHRFYHHIIEASMLIQNFSLGLLFVINIPAAHARFQETGNAADIVYIFAALLPQFLVMLVSSPAVNRHSAILSGVVNMPYTFYIEVIEHMQEELVRVNPPMPINERRNPNNEPVTHRVLVQCVVLFW